MEFDRDKLAQNGLNLTTAATFMRNRVYGSTASYYREDGEEYNIRVRYAPEFRTDLEDIEKIIAMVDILTGGKDNGGYYY